MFEAINNFKYNFLHNIIIINNSKPKLSIELIQYKNNKDTYLIQRLGNLDLIKRDS